MEQIKVEADKDKKGAPVGLSVFVLALVWGFSLVVIEGLLDVLRPIQVLTVRWTMAAIFFLIPVALGKLKIDFHKPGVKYLLLTGVAEPCAYAIFETNAVDSTSPSISAIFIATIPCMVMILQLLIFREKISKMGVASIFIAMTGVLICTIFSPSFSGAAGSFGIIMLIGVVLSGGFYGILGGKAAESYGPLEVTTMMSVEAAIFFNILNIAMGYGAESYRIVFSDFRYIGRELFLALGCSVLCFILFNYVMGKMDTTLANNLVGSMVTAVGVVAGILITKDPWGTYTVIGVAVTLIGVWLSSRAEKHMKEKE